KKEDIMNRKSKWQEHINVYTNFLTPYNFSCYLLMLSKSHYLIALSYNRLAEENKDFESYLNKFDTFYKKQSITDISWFDPELYFKKSKKNKPKTRKKK
ncbi:MAG TPA: hypothetical protein LFV91_07320, partial [Rickettsia endosymbiont of Bembidion nr. Transversale]|nr:hypothetical protein [Rickettsia endosymbiont of Bembidion nr. Transversale]